MRIALVSVVAIAVAFLAPSVPGPGPVAAQPELREPAPEDYVVVQRYRDAARVFAQREGEPTLEELGYEVVPVPEGKSTEAFLDELARDPDIRRAEHAAPVSAASEPNDPYFPANQRGYLESVHVPAAWELAVGREEVVVAVVDTGVDTGHPDLAPRLWTNPNEFGAGTDADGNGCVDDVHGCRFVSVTGTNAARCGYEASDGAHTGDVEDDHDVPATGDHSHGTMVSGILGAAGNNSQGVTGVAWNIRIMPIKVLDCYANGRMPDVARGIEYARQMGADVINVSIASDPGNETANSAMLRDAIAAAEAEGIIIVAAAGNSGRTSDPSPGYPAAYDQYSNLIAVGASDWEAGHTWEGYSSYGPQLDFAAPGGGLATTVRREVAQSAPYMQTSNGTSFSAPLVSGMFALMFSANSRLGHEAYIDLARETATSAPAAPHGENWAGSGIINVRGAIERIPMTVTGVPQHDWVDVAAGTPVEARVNGTRCGETTSTALGIAARFEMTVAAGPVSHGCGEPGATVTFLVNGSPTGASLTWGGPTDELLYTGIEVSSVSAPPGSVIVQELSPGWNNVAHFEGDGSPPAALAYLPASWEAVYHWHADEDAYRRVFRTTPSWTNTWTTAAAFDAYWVWVPSAGTAASGNSLPDGPRTVALEPGWNNVTYTGTSREMSDALAGLEGQFNAVLQYDNDAGAWRSYVPGRPRYLNSVGGLLTAGVYWIYMDDAAELEME